MNCTITCLVDNRTSRLGLTAEHGLSFLIRYQDKKYLFDTGQTNLIFHNAGKLGLDLTDLDGLIISHGHFDHTGGVAELLKRINREIPIYLHPQALNPKYLKIKDNKFQDIGFGITEKEIRELGGSFVFNKEPIQIIPGLWLTGEIPRTEQFELPEPKFFSEQNGKIEPDLILDDQAVVLETDLGLVVVLGCAHTGIINTLNWVKNFSKGKKIYAVLGGTHLMAANEERIKKTAELLIAEEIEKLGVCHCTGFPAAAYLFSVFKEKFLELEAGSVFSC